MASRGVDFIEVDGERVRAYTLVYAAQVLDMSERTLMRQVQSGTFRGADAWPPKVSPNETTRWLLSGDDVDEMARAMPGYEEPPPLVAVESSDVEREIVALRKQVERYELEEAVRYQDRVAELEREVEQLRRQNVTLTAEMQRMMTLASNMLAAFGPQPVAHAS